MERTNKATEKQIKYLRYLMSQTGHGHERFLGAWTKPYGLLMKERSGSIDTISFDVATKLIDGLKEEQAS